MSDQINWADDAVERRTAPPNIAGPMIHPDVYNQESSRGSVGGTFGYEESSRSARGGRFGEAPDPGSGIGAAAGSMGAGAGSGLGAAAGSVGAGAGSGLGAAAGSAASSTVGSGLGAAAGSVASSSVGSGLGAAAGSVGAGAGVGLGAAVGAGLMVNTHGGGGTAALPACTWETTETKFIAFLQELGRKAEQVTQAVSRGIQDARNTLEDWKDGFLGKLFGAVFDFIDSVLAAIDTLVRVVNEAVQLVVWVVPKIMAPWTIRSIGRLMQDPFVNKVQIFSDSLSISHTESQKSWHSAAGDEWRARASEQQDEGGVPTVAATKRFADVTTEMGDRAVAACEQLAGDLTGGLTDIVDVVKDLKKITKLLPALFKGAMLAFKIVMLVIDIIKFANEVTDSSQDFINAVDGPLASRWPNAASL